MTAVRRSLVLVGLLSIGVFGVWAIIEFGTDEVPSANDTGIGPRATNANVSIDYPADADPLDVTPAEFVEVWTAEQEILDAPEVMSGDDTTTFWAAETTAGMRAAVDLAEVDGLVAVAQLSVENAAGDADDVTLVEETIPAFLAGVGAPYLADDLGLDDAESLFGDEPRESTVAGSGVVAYLAVNEFSLVLGVVGDG